jgi:NitT/TauT family transport system substrate-binding protein
MNPWPGYEALTLAQEKGFFAAAGLDVQLIEYNSLGDVLRAFLKGQIDGMTATLIEALQACAQLPHCPRIALVADFSNGMDVLVAHDAIPTLAGLRGKRIAVEPGSLGIFMLARALTHANMTLAEVTIVSMDQTRMPQALATGAVEAAVTYPPTLLEIRRQGGTTTLFTSADIPGEVIDVIALAPQALAARPGVVAGLRRAWDLALGYMHAHPDDAHRLMAARERISLEDFRQVLAGIQVLDTPHHQRLLTNGTLLRTIKSVDQVLRYTGQLSGPDRTADLLALTMAEGPREP